MIIFIADKLRIKAMFPGQPAENCGKLRVGDIIIAANGVQLTGKTSRDAINILRDQPARVVLTVERDPSSIPVGLLRRGSFSQSLNPNEVLTAIQSKIELNDLRVSTGPAHKASSNDKPDGHKSRGPDEICSRESSEKCKDTSRIVQDKHELHQGDVRTNEGNGNHHDTSQKESRTIKSIDGILKVTNGETIPRQNALHCTTNGDGSGRDEALVDNARVCRSSSQIQDNASSSQTSGRPSSNKDNPIPKSVNQETDLAKTMVRSGGLSDDRLSTGSISDNEIGNGDERLKGLEHNADSTHKSMKDELQSPLDSGLFTSQNESDAGAESEKIRSEKIILGLAVDNEGKERLAPDEEVCAFGDL